MNGHVRKVSAVVNECDLFTFELWGDQVNVYNRDSDALMHAPDGDLVRAAENYLWHLYGDALHSVQFSFEYEEE